MCHFKSAEFINASNSSWYLLVLAMSTMFIILPFAVAVTNVTNPLLLPSV